MIKHLIPFMVLYVLVNDGGKEYVASFQGQSTGTVTSLMLEQERTFSFIAEKDYQDFVEAHKPSNELDPDLAAAKLILLNKSKTDAERIDAIIKYLALDR